VIIPSLPSQANDLVAFATTNDILLVNSHISKTPLLIKHHDSQIRPRRIFRYTSQNTQPFNIFAAVICEQPGRRRARAISAADGIQNDIVRVEVNVLNPIRAEKGCGGITRVASDFGKVCREAVTGYKIQELVYMNCGENVRQVQAFRKNQYVNDRSTLNLKAGPKRTRS
jgi:hypothetical protein